jgi:transcriptional regulator with XRE-family HTH domain
VPDGFDLCGVLRRVRRMADLSQRELASAAGLSASSVAHAEAGTRDLPVAGLVRIAAVADLRLAVLDANGTEVTAMSGDAVRDRGRRFFPAHLDTRHGDDRWWYAVHRYDRPQPWYTFDRDRSARDSYRRRDGTPDDHQLPQPGDSPADRAEARRRAEWQRRQEKLERARQETVGQPWDDGFTCVCPAACAELDDYSGRPVHAPDCACHCDVG